MKKTIVAVLAVFVLWGVLDFLLHGLILTSAYQASAQLWRPMAEFKMGLNYFVGLVAAACFVYVFAAMIPDHGPRGALRYGLVFGIGAGISMGYGSYAVMPLPYTLALAWFLGSLVKALLGALVAAWIVGAKAA